MSSSSMTKFEALRKIQDGAIENVSSLNRVASKYFEAAKTGETITDSVTAGLLNNFQRALGGEMSAKANKTYKRVMDSANTGAAGITGAGNVDGNAINVQGDFGPYVMDVFPIVTAWYPDFPLKDLISVQHMDKPLAYLFFSKLVAGTNKAETAQGDVVETALGMRSIKGKYPTGEIYEEAIPVAEFTSNKTLLAYAPLNVADIQGRYLAKHKVVVDPASANAIYGGAGRDSAGKAYAEISGSSVVLYQKLATIDATKYLTIDIQTGELDTTHAATAVTTNVKVNYVWQLDYATDENIQKVKEQVEMRPMEALPRALSLEWTVFSEFVKKSQFGQDIKTDNVKRILNLLYQYQVRYILDELENDNTDASTTTISLNFGTSVALEVANANILKAVNGVSNAIELASGRFEGNRIVAGVNLKTYLDSLPENMFKRAKDSSTGFSGPRELGEWGRYKVYYDPFLAADKAIMSWKGEEFYDAPYVLGEYMPIVPTDAVTLGVTVREAFVAMEAYNFYRPETVKNIQFTI